MKRKNSSKITFSKEALNLLLEHIGIHPIVKDSLYEFGCRVDSHSKKYFLCSDIQNV